MSTNFWDNPRISPINNRCIRAVSLMHPRSNLALPDLSPPFGWPIPALYDWPTDSWYNYAHYAQYRTNPRSVCLVSTTGLKWIIKANVMSTDSLMKVQYPICAYGPYKSDFKWCIHLRGVDRGWASHLPPPHLPLPPLASLLPSRSGAKLSSFHFPPFFSPLSLLPPPLLPPPSPFLPLPNPSSAPHLPLPLSLSAPLILVEVSFYICNCSV